MKKLKVLIAGCGSMGRNHVRVYSENHRVTEVIAFDPSKESLKMVEAYQKTRTFTDLNEA